MKKILTLILCSLTLFVVQSCSNDDDNTFDPEIGAKEVAVNSLNATISSVLIKSGKEIIFESSGLDKTYYSQKISNRKEVYIEVTAIVDTNERALVNFGEVIGGDAIGIVKQTEKEQAVKGEKIKVSGTITFLQ
ncbi:hypothetical protein CLV62_13814 [Dysgonomonas alginatilytica]|uniref:Uncharacterized protein n=1 Tax=Dysgonomonas alginatilytica TaxID=1605892 RepID=A0A2V3PJ40_9BACT|nr:hypothetical protein [Dysgonomonas alginatilytica]PXV59310.1 hypothetical protein CLV62_13814 [Dysgonomonas alginatilytica]